MPTVELLGGKVQIYQRGNSRFWQARASVGGRQRQFSTKQEGQELAAKAAESWYFKLHGQAEAGVLNDRPTFRKAAEQFLKEYGVITEGERSETERSNIPIFKRTFFIMHIYQRIGLAKKYPRCPGDKGRNHLAGAPCNAIGRIQIASGDG